MDPDLSPIEAMDLYREELAARVRRAPLRGFDIMAANRYVALNRILTEATSLEEAKKIAFDALEMEEE